MVEQLPNILQFFVTSLLAVAEQVITVPKISHDRTQQRLIDTLRQLQPAEQLVEVPTIVSCSSLQGIVEQNADIPLVVVVWEAFKIYAVGKIQQRLAEQCTLTFQFLMVVLVGLVREAFKVSPRERFYQRLVEQISLTFPFRVVEVFKVLVMDRVQQPHPRTQAFAGWRFFALSQKSAEVGQQEGAGVVADTG